MACYQKVLCPQCGSQEVWKAGKSANDTQRYKCNTQECSTQTFMLDYRYRACKPGVKEQAIEMVINSSGIRDTARVLKISKSTVINAIKKKRKSSLR